jgi:hypothetical protein
VDTIVTSPPRDTGVHGRRDHEIRIIGHVAAGGIKRLVFQEDHRIIVADRGAQQAFHIGRRGGHHHFQAGHAGQDLVDRLAVLRGGVEPAP